MIVDFPELSPKSWNFLNEKEAAFVVARIEQDRHDIKLEPFFLGKYLRHGLDSKVWGFSALYTLTTTNSYAIAYFLPIILRDGMGFSVAKAQCLVAPPYVAAAIAMVIQAYYGDKWHLRGPIIVGNCCVGMQTICLNPLPTNCNRHFGTWASRLYNQRWRSLLWCFLGHSRL
jgi:hypothetical protein